MGDRQPPILMEDLKAWMSTHQWREVGEGSAGWMWEHGPSEARVGIVRNLDDDRSMQEDISRRLAPHHQMTAQQVAEQVRGWRIDTVNLRASNDHVISETIPLTAGAAMVDSARRMFRSAATAARRPREAIDGNYAAAGDEIAQEIRMGHTLRGSYILPVHIKVGLPEEPGDQPSLTGWDEIAPAVESNERRTTRTFAQALTAVQERIIAPEREPVDSRIDEAVALGVTREFLTAITGVFNGDSISDFEARFRWAGAHQPPYGVPDEVSVPAAAKPRLEAVQRKLKTSRRRDDVFTGPVVLIAREPTDTSTRFAIRTINRGRPARVETTTTAGLDEVTEWMRSGVTIQISGTVTRSVSGLAVPNSTVVVLEELPAHRP